MPRRSGASHHTKMALTLVTVAIIIYMVAMIVVVVPLNVDEAVQYHPLACSEYPNAVYHTFWNPCDGTTHLRVFNITIPRAYYYIGSLSSFIYYPFFKLYPAMATQRLVGVLFLVAILWVMRRLEPAHSLSVLVIFGLSFPFIYQLVAETGPVRFGLWTMLLTPLLVRAMCTAERGWRLTLLNLALGVCVFLAIEDKPFFLYFLPSLAALAVAYWPAEPQLRLKVPHIIAKTWLAVVVSGLLCAVYLLGARTSGGDSYFASLVGSVKQQDIVDVSARAASYLTNFEKFTSMVYETRQFRWLNIPITLLVWLCGFFFVLRAFYESSAERHKLRWTALALILSLLILLGTRNAWAGHHFIYSVVLALVLMCQALAHVKFGRTLFLVVYALAAITMTSELPFLKPDGRWSKERYIVFDYLRRPDVARNHVIAHVSMGTYYLASLYGHADQLSVQILELNASTAHELVRLSTKTARKLLVVCRREECDAQRLSQDVFRGITFEPVQLPTADWQVFVEIERALVLGARKVGPLVEIHAPS